MKIPRSDRLRRRSIGSEGLRWGCGGLGRVGEVLGGFDFGEFGGGFGGFGGGGGVGGGGGGGGVGGESGVGTGMGMEGADPYGGFFQNGY